MTKWQLPQGVEYPISVTSYEADLSWMVSRAMYKSAQHIHSDKSLNMLIEQGNDSFAQTIRINNSIDLVKIEE